MPDLALITLGADAAPALFTPDNIIALLTLSLMEIVLGIDNIVFIAILAAKLPEAQRARARQVGIALALVSRLALLFTITLIMAAAKTKLFTIPLLGHDLTGRDLVLVLGGLFLIYKATKEIHHKMEGDEHAGAASPRAVSFLGVVGQIMLLDIVFSLDSVITAVGMAQALWVMVVAVIVSVIVMLAFSGAIVGFIDRHPTMKMLALSFLLLIGVVLVADGVGQHISKGYIYFAMTFSLMVEVLNMRTRRKRISSAAAAHL